MEVHQGALRVMEIPPANTIEEAAVILRYRSPTVIYTLLEAGELRSSVVGGKRLITGESIAELLRKGEQQVYAPTRESPKTLHLRKVAADADTPPNPATKKNAAGDKITKVA